jgi:hypothetical protein
MDIALDCLGFEGCPLLKILLLYGSCCFCESFTSVPFPLTVPLTLIIALSFFQHLVFGEKTKVKYANFEEELIDNRPFMDKK